MLRQLLLMARRHSRLPILVTGVPIASFFAMLVTVTTCVLLWRSGPHWVPGLLFPAISQLGIDPPQRYVYQLGFVGCGGLLSLGILMYEELLAPELLAEGERREPYCVVLHAGMAIRIEGLRATPSLNGAEGTCKSLDEATGRWNVVVQGTGEPKAVRPENLIAIERERRRHSSSGERGQEGEATAELLQRSLRWGYATAIGVVVQGIFTLEREISLTCFMHWGGAVLFVAGAMQHGWASNELYDGAAQRGLPLLKGPSRSVSRALRVRHIILDYSGVATFLLPLLMQLLGTSEAATEPMAPTPLSASPVADRGRAAGPSRTTEEPSDAKTVNAIGIMQWAIILQLALYFCTYTVDLRSAAFRLLAADRSAAAAPGFSVAAAEDMGPLATVVAAAAVATAAAVRPVAQDGIVGGGSTSAAARQAGRDGVGRAAGGGGAPCFEMRDAWL